MTYENNIENRELATGNQELETKILVAGVGGQGVVFLTNLIVEAAMQANIPVATSEIHGLSQRGGSVTAGITIGKNGSGFTENAGVDILIGLEPLEAQRCISLLHKKSIVIIDDNKIYPYSVNSGHAKYPDIFEFAEYLKKNIDKVIYITDNNSSDKAIYRTLFTLGRLCTMSEFPIKVEFIEKAIKKIARPGFYEKSIAAFHKGQIKNNITVE